MEIYVVSWSLLMTKKTVTEHGFSQASGCVYGCELFYKAEDAVTFSQKKEKELSTPDLTHNGFTLSNPKVVIERKTIN